MRTNFSTVQCLEQESYSSDTGTPTNTEREREREREIPKSCRGRQRESEMYIREITTTEYEDIYRERTKKITP